MHINLPLAAASLLVAFPVQAQIFESFSFNPNLAIPDGNAAGVSDTRTILSTGTAIISLDVTLNITGDFNGDLYAYLRHDSGFSVLLNRAGRDTGNTFGYADSGFDITFSSSALKDVHTYQTEGIPSQGVKLSGTWQPDGRDINPFSVVSSDTRSAPLDSFTGLNPNGEWTLFVADLQNGGTSHINSWGINVTVVPEPRTVTLASALALGGLAAFRRYIRRKRS